MSRKEAGVELEGHFMIRVIYNDDATYALVGAASKVLSKSYFKFFLKSKFQLFYSRSY
jgi:hypothetical protein